MRRMLFPLTTAVSLTAVVAVVGPANAGVLFEEDFSNYNQFAPGVTTNGEFSILNDAIGTQKGWLNATVEKETMLFTEPKALPPGNAFDVCCRYELAASNSSFAVVFATGDGKRVFVPFVKQKGKRSAVLKAAGGELAVWTLRTNRFVKTRTFELPGELRTVNFKLKPGGKVSLSDIVVRTPEPLPAHAALEQFPAVAALTQEIADAKVSDGKPLDFAERSYSFVPGATGVVGRIRLVWDSGAATAFDLAVGDLRYASPLPGAAMKQLGIKGKKVWCGKDAVIAFTGLQQQLCVRPHLKAFADWHNLCDKGVDVVRDWDALPPASRHVTTFELRETADRGFNQFWVDGSFVRAFGPSRDDKKAAKVVTAELTLKAGVRYRENKIVPDELELWARPKAKAFAAATQKGSVDGCVKPLDSADVGLAHYAQGGYAMTDDAYTMRSPLDGYPGEVHFRVPAAPYVKAEILFCLDDAPGKVPVLTARIAHYPVRGGSGHTEIEDSVLDLTGGILPSVAQVGAIVRNGREYPLYRTEIELPLGKCLDFAAGDFIDVEFLGPMMENLQQDDRRRKPRHDVSSAFNLFGVKLRKLNVLPEMVQSQPGNVFAAEESVKETSVKLTALVDGAKGVLRIGEREYPYAFAKAGEVVTNVYDFSDAEVGIYRLPMTVDDGTSTLAHEIVACVTPETGRLATAEESPYGTWWFNTHGSPGDPKIGGPLVRKAGIRKISWNKLKPEEWKEYDCTTAGNVYGFGFNEFDPATGRFKPGKVKRDGKDVEVDGEARFVEHVQKKIAEKPFVDHLMVWHETAPWCGGIPEELLGLAAPTNDVKREKELAAYINEIGRICRKHFPNLKIQIGNSMHSIGAVAIPLRGGANPDYYDLIGLEPPCETSTPERMTDVGFVGQNISKAIGKKLSGRDLKTGGCYEFIYRCERDLGADGEELQARFYTRDILISLMNDYTLIAPGCMFDNRSAYCSTIWGVNAFLRRSPYVYPKQSYLAYAVITKALDGVKFVREIPTGSTTVYAAEFLRKDGKYATAFWCARGEADLVCDVKGELWTMYGRRSDVGGWFSDAKFICSGAPCYLISKKPCASVKIAARRFPEDARIAAQGKPVTDLALANVTVAPDPEMESRHHRFLPYLKPGVFTAKDVVDPEEGACLELTLDTEAKTPFPATEFVTEYTTVRLNKPVEIPGVAGLLGLRVKGDSGWGQVRFEIEDAKGEVFKGLSTGPSWGCDVYDWPGYTALSFDGWSDVYQYTDRNDYGLAISPGMRDEQWVSATGGNKRIDWPVKLRAVTVCVCRYKPTILGFVEAKNPSVRLKRLWSAPAK